MDKVKVQELERVFEPLFYYWKQNRLSKAESFGDFTNRMVRTITSGMLMSRFIGLSHALEHLTYVMYIFSH